MAGEVSVRRSPGEVRDAIIAALRATSEPASVTDIRQAVERELGPVAASSIRSYLNKNAGPGKVFDRVGRGTYSLR